jgi:nucleoid-associated protein EbfC
MSREVRTMTDVPDIPDIGDLLRQAMAMQEQLMAAQQEAAERTVEGSAGGGLVRIEMTGAGEPTAVHLAPEVIDPDDPELLEDLVLAALRDALHRVQELQASAMGGLDLGALGGLGGAGGLGLGDGSGLGRPGPS